jgi:hypothetical protein
MTAGVLFVGIASMFSGGYYDARLAWCFAALAAALAVSRPAPAAVPPQAERSLAPLGRPG